MDTEPIQNNDKQLLALRPSEGSIPWLRQNKNQEQANKLEAEATNAIRTLSNYKDNPFTEDDMNTYSILASKTGSLLLRDWVRFNQFYSFPPIEEDISFFKKTDKELYQNLAAITRDEAFELRNKDMHNKADEKMKLALSYFNRYSSNRVPSIHYDISPVTIEELQERSEIVSLFFNPEVEKAYEDLFETTDTVANSEMQIEGVDAGLIRVWLECPPPPQDFPFVYDEYQKLKKYIAGKHNITVEDMDRFMEWKLQAMLPKEVATGLQN